MREPRSVRKGMDHLIGSQLFTPSGSSDHNYYTAHPLRAAILSEIHARPFAPISIPNRLLHLAFATTEEDARIDRNNLARFCAAHEILAPSRLERHFRASFGEVSLRWEQHSEFTTCTWEAQSPATNEPFVPTAATLEPRAHTSSGSTLGGGRSACAEAWESGRFVRCAV